MHELISDKKKIINDPIYGFIRIPDALHFDLISHPYFQRLRRIKQLGLTQLVYPGALHTRFHHSLGAMHLMQRAIQILRSKGHQIPDEDEHAASLAILMHDLGHGPYSHSLEESIVTQLNHEQLTQLFIHHLNQEWNGKLEHAKQVFNGSYHKKYLSKLVSSQLDIDRLDYLRRDSFYTGVAEGSINSERLLSMLEIREDEPVIEAKGIYSVENFLVARRLMYWQVYLHKTVLAAEYMLKNVIKRARKLSLDGIEVFATPALAFFLKNEPNFDEFMESKDLIELYASLDDHDIFISLKQWQTHPDKILAYLSKSIVNRNLFKVELSTHEFKEGYIEGIRSKIMQQMQLSREESEYLNIHEITSNNAYNRTHKAIRILYRDGSLRNASEAADLLNIQVLAQPVTKYFVCYPKNLT